MSINWKKTAIVVCDIVIATYLLLAVTAFNKPDTKATHCSEVKIDIQETVVDGFLNAGEIKKILSQNHIYPLTQPMASVNPRQIEEVLEKSPFVEKAECYAQQTLTRVANHIMQDDFWKNQVVQINVLNNGYMEIVPRIGDHIIFLGTPSHVDKKLERLRKFYLYGLNKAGWNKYSYISVEFDNQIIGNQHTRK